MLRWRVTLNVLLLRVVSFHSESFEHQSYSYIPLIKIFSFSPSISFVPSYYTIFYPPLYVLMNIELFIFRIERIVIFYFLSKDCFPCKWAVTECFKLINESTFFARISIHVIYRRGKFWSKKRSCLYLSNNKENYCSNQLDSTKLSVENSFYEPHDHRYLFTCNDSSSTTMNGIDDFCFILHQWKIVVTEENGRDDWKILYFDFRRQLR